jgi:modification methylase
MVSSAKTMSISSGLRQARISKRSLSNLAVEHTAKVSSHVITGDCVAEMNRLADENLQPDLIFADPPYFMRLPKNKTLTRTNGSEVRSVKDHAWDHFEDVEDYLRFTRGWLTAARNLMGPRTSLIASGTYHNVYLMGGLMMQMGFWVINDIIWAKTNPIPNFAGTRLTNSHEILMWVVKDAKARPQFDYQGMKAMNGGKQMRDVWTMPLCSRAERLRNTDGHAAHPTQKPQSLLDRIVRMACPPGGLVLDPFFGTGTTGVAAQAAGRRWVGIERDADMAELARNRILSP